MRLILGRRATHARDAAFPRSGGGPGDFLRGLGLRVVGTGAEARERKQRQKERQPKTRRRGGGQPHGVGPEEGGDA